MVSAATHCGAAREASARQRRNWDYPLLLAARYRFHSAGSAAVPAMKKKRSAWRRWLLRAVAGAPDAVADHLRPERRASADRSGKADWLPGYEALHSRSISAMQPRRSFSWTCSEKYRRSADRRRRKRTAISRSRPLPRWRRRSSITSAMSGTEPDDGIWETRGGRKTLYPLQGDGLGSAGPRHQTL